VEYKKGAIIRLKDSFDGTYGQIEEVYIYHDHKVFVVTALEVLEYEESRRSLKVTRTQETRVCLYKHFCVHSVLHLREIDSNLYLIDWNVVNQRN